jgi:chemotaxis signal transduction protein
VDRSAAVALAVDAIERQIRLPRAALADGARRAPGASNLLSVASSGDETWTIVDVPAVLDGLRSRAPVHTQETSVR